MKDSIIAVQAKIAALNPASKHYTNMLKILMNSLMVMTIALSVVQLSSVIKF